MDLTTAARVKTFAGITTATHDTWLAQVVPQMSAAMARFMNRLGVAGEDYVAQQAQSEVFDPTGLDAVFLLRGVPVDDQQTFTISYPDALPATDYLVDYTSGIIRFSTPPLASSTNRMTVAYTGGLGTDFTDLLAKAPEVVLAAEMQLSALLRERDALGSTSVSVAGSAISFTEPGSWLPVVRRMLARFKV